MELDLVRIDKKKDKRIPGLEEVRAEVLREWQNDQREEARETFFTSLEEKYEVVLPE